MSKTVISFDIGIKHLSYCLFSYESSPEHLRIIQWDILNLMPEQQGGSQKTTCCQCCKKSLYVSPKENQTFCEKHAKLSPFFIPVLKIQTKTREELLQLLGEKTGNKQTGLEISTKTALLEHIKSHMLKKRKPTQKTQDVSLIDIGRKLTTLLSERIPLDKLDYCLIENQIGNLANRMKTIQGMITEYFIIKSPETHIEYISSHNKGNLRLPVSPSFSVQPIQEVYAVLPKQNIPENTTTTIEPNNVDKKKTNYTENKKQSVELVKRICPSTHLDFFLSHKKKDDLADCFLQGIWFVKVKNK